LEYTNKSSEIKINSSIPSYTATCRYLTLSQMAAPLNKSPQTLRNWITLRRQPFYDMTVKTLTGRRVMHVNKFKAFLQMFYDEV